MSNITYQLHSCKVNLFMSFAISSLSDEPAASAEAAVEAGSAAAHSLGEVIATHVIPRPHADVEKLLPSIK